MEIKEKINDNVGLPLLHAAIIGLAYILILEIILPEKILLKEFMTAFMEPPFKSMGLIIYIGLLVGSDLLYIFQALLEAGYPLMFIASSLIITIGVIEILRRLKYKHKGKLIEPKYEEKS